MLVNEGVKGKPTTYDGYTVDGLRDSLSRREEKRSCLEKKENWVAGEVARWSYLERTVWLIDCI